MPDAPLEKKSQNPLYQQLMRRLQNDVAAGAYPPGGRIPSEQVLCDTYGVSRVTVRKAMLDLVQEGLLVRKQGKGTFVADARLKRDLQHITSFSDACRGMGRTAGSRLVELRRDTGSFALHAARYGAAEVTGVDISEHACACALENARLNGVEDRVRFECANAFDFLRAQQAAGEQYDVVILDPPAFTKTRSAVEGALRGYKEINLRGMKLTRDGGYFITCSCSQHVTPDLFRGMLLEAQKDAHVQLRQIEWRTQGRDHPILLASPETQYLKCGIFQVFK